MLETLYPTLKALHLLAVIAWMAGIMYLPRLFVYHHDAVPGGEAERLFTEMERRLLKLIMNPAMIATFVLGFVTLLAVPAYVSAPWFWVKIVAVFGIAGVHGVYAKAFKAFAAGERPRTQKFWRMMNEVPFLLLAIVVFMVILKPFG